jgi:hypothetical protein
MPVQITCPGCQVKLKAPDTAVGKKTKCPKCQTIVSVPANGSHTGAAAAAAQAPTTAAASTATSGKTLQWFLQTPDGSQYGPVPRSELDQWYAEGRISADCQLLQEGQTQWQWAPEQYPALSPAATATSGAAGSSAASLGGAAAGLSPLSPLSPAKKPEDPFGLAPLGTPGLSPLGNAATSTFTSSTATLPSFTTGTAPGPFAPSSSPQSSYGAGATTGYGLPAPAGYAPYPGSYPRQSSPHAMAIISGIFSILFGVWNSIVGLILIAVGFFFLIGGGTAAVATAHDKPEAAGALMMILGTVGALGILLGILPLAYGIAQGCTGVGVIRRRQWARIVTFIFCALCFMNLCIHVLGILTLNPYSFLVFFVDLAFITIQMIAMCLPDVTRDFT